MSITAALGFNTESFAFDGFVRLEDDPIQNRTSFDDVNDEEEAPSEVKMKKEPTQASLADHALVFMCRPILDKWVQPIAVFASRGAAPTEDLRRLLMAVIIKLQLQAIIPLYCLCSLMIDLYLCDS